MKKALILIAFACGLALFSRPVAAQSNATVGAEYPWRLQIELGWSGATLTKADGTQFYQSDVSVGGSVIAAAASSIPALNVDLIVHGSDTVTTPINGTPTTVKVSDLVAGLASFFAAQRAGQLRTH